MKRIVGIRNSHPRLRVSAAQVRRVIAELDRNAAVFRGGCPPGELSLAFLTDPALARIHDDFMDDPTPTDVITFSGSPAGIADTETTTAGEICVSVDTAARFVSKRNKRSSVARNASEFAAELTLYVVHGWLHLAGYDDLDPASKRQMRAAEKRAMTVLRKAMAIPAFRLA